MSPDYASPLYLEQILGTASQRLFRGLPWVVDAWEGDGLRCATMHNWCSDRLGPPRLPFAERQRPGHWRSFSVRVFGWGRWAFSSREESEAFLAAFPPPEFVRSCERR